IGGALEFVDCAEVTVDTVTLSCGSAVASGAACLTVRNSITAANLTTGFGTVRVSGSQLIVGQMQTGILLVHVRQAFIDRNEISAAPGRPISFLSSLANARYRTLATRALVGSASTAAVKTAAPDAPKSRARKKSAPAAARAAPAVTAPAGPAGGPIAGAAAAPILASRPPNAGVTVGGTTVSFNTPQQLKGVWQTYVDTQGPKEFASNADLLAFVKRSAATLLTNPAAQRQFAGFSQLVRNFERLQVLVARAGIVVGGRAVSELRVADNVIGGFLQGVVVGTSHREKSPTLPADTAGNVVIRDNQVSLTLDVIQGHAAGRFGILVGNVRSLLIDSNRISLTLSGGQYLHSEGIRVFGYLGS